MPSASAALISPQSVLSASTALNSSLTAALCRVPSHSSEPTTAGWLLRFIGVCSIVMSMSVCLSVCLDGYLQNRMQQLAVRKIHTTSATYIPHSSHISKIYSRRQKLSHAHIPEKLCVITGGCVCVSSCRPCDVSCSACTGPSVGDCIECADTYWWEIGACVQNCSDGYYGLVVEQQRLCQMYVCSSRLSREKYSLFSHQPL